jgi:hypothetical protein
LAVFSKLDLVRLDLVWWDLDVLDLVGGICLLEWAWLDSVMLDLFKLIFFDCIWFSLTWFGLAGFGLAT